MGRLSDHALLLGVPPKTVVEMMITTMVVTLVDHADRRRLEYNKIMMPQRAPAPATTAPADPDHEENEDNNVKRDEHPGRDPFPLGIDGTHANYRNRHSRRATV